MSPTVQSKDRARGPRLGEASFTWAGCGVQFATFDMKVDGGGTGVVANVGGFGDKYGVGDVSTTCAPLLDGADLGSLLAGGLTIGGFRGFELFRQGLELVLRFFDHVLDLVGPRLRVVEGVDHLLKCEREL